MLQHVCGGKLNLDLIRRTANTLNLPIQPVIFEHDEVADALLHEALDSRRITFALNHTNDNLDKTMRTMYNNPLSAFVWHLANLEMWRQGWSEFDRDTQLESFETEIKRYL